MGQGPAAAQRSLWLQVPHGAAGSLSAGGPVQRDTSTFAHWLSVAQYLCLLARGLPQFLASRHNSSPHGPWLVATSRRVCPRWEPQRPCHLPRAVAHPCYQVLLSRFGSSWEGAEVWTLRGSLWGVSALPVPLGRGTPQACAPQWSSGV